VLQRSQDRDELIPAVQIEGHFGDWQTIQTLVREGQTHVDTTVKIRLASLLFS
jgi:hypothetical protein